MLIYCHVVNAGLPEVLARQKGLLGLQGRGLERGAWWRAHWRPARALPRPQGADARRSGGEGTRRQTVSGGGS